MFDFLDFFTITSEKYETRRGQQKEIDFIQILVLIGIIMAAVGAAVYYLKGFRKKS